jgi:hypothetical protein
MAWRIEPACNWYYSTSCDKKTSSKQVAAASRCTIS